MSQLGLMVRGGGAIHYARCLRLTRLAPSRALASTPVITPSADRGSASRSAREAVRVALRAVAVELHGGRFVPVDLSGEVFGNYATLNDAREALLQSRR